MEPSRSRLTQRDFGLLAFVAEHRVIVAAQAQRFLGVSSSVAYARLRALTGAGLLRRQNVLHGHPACYLATTAGIRAADRPYRAQKLEPGLLQHDLGLASLWLAARAGTFGEVREVISERAMRSHDARTAHGAETAAPTGPLGVRLGGVGEAGRERLHYPDLLLVTPKGKRVAVELELTSKGVARRERVLMGYAFDRRIEAVVYLVPDISTGRRIQESARRIGVSNLVHVQLVKGSRASGASRALTRSADRLREVHAR